MISSTRRVAFVRKPDKCRAIVAPPAAAEPIPATRVPRISRLMALAIQFDRFIREGKVRDQSELARLTHITQPRMTQIMNLNHLAPDIQEKLLCLRPTARGRELKNEKTLRKVVALAGWREQRALWRCAQGRHDRRS